MGDFTCSPENTPDVGFGFVDKSVSITVAASHQGPESGSNFFVPAMNRRVEEVLLIITREDAQLVAKVHEF